MYMIGLIVLIAAAVYLALLIWATRAVYRWAKKDGWSKGKCWAAATGGFLAVYLPVFWDYIPTLIVHKYYCEKEAGFWIYKTMEQWKKENPGVAETLTWSNQERQTVDPKTGGRMLHLNERITERLNQHRLLLLPITISDYGLIDSKNEEMLAKQVIVSAGYGNMMVSSDWRGMKFWLQLGSCFGHGISGMHAFNPVRESFKKIGVQR
jgi:hypothetical protein